MTTYSAIRKLIGITVSLLSIIGFLSEATADTEGMLYKSSQSFDAYPIISKSVSFQGPTSPDMQFRDGSIGNLKYLRLTKELRIRGWKVRENVYVGHTKVANRWGLGVLVKHRGVVYGINNRGLQILKQF